MNIPVNNEDISKLKKFIEFVSDNTYILHLPQFEFLKSFIEKLGGRVPNAPKSESKQSDETKTEKPSDDMKQEDEESEPESDIELELMDTVLQADEAVQEMGEINKEPTEEEMDQASDLRAKGAKAFSDGEFEEAINYYTEAILLNPAPLFYAKRGQAFLKLNKPVSAIFDCDRALQLNPDNAAAYKFRGRAHRLLGNWQEAAKDLRQACKLDYDDQANDWLKEVSSNAKKIEQHKLKQERKKAEKEDRARKERIRRAQEANKKAAEENERKQQDSDFMGAAMGPDIMDAFNDPEIAAALQDVMSNPANIMKYQNNPKVMNLLKKFAGAAGAGGFGGFPGGFPFGGGAPPQFDSKPEDAKPKEQYDDGLD